MLNFLLARLGEPSTWAGFALLANGVHTALATPGASPVVVGIQGIGAIVAMFLPQSVPTASAVAEASK